MNHALLELKRIWGCGYEGNVSVVTIFVWISAGPDMVPHPTIAPIELVQPATIR